MIGADVLAFVRANLPPPPARVLEIGAGDGELAAALTRAGYDVVAIDPEPSGGNVQACALVDLEMPAVRFDSAIAVVSLHHVEPLAASLERLADSLEPGAGLIIDEFDVGAFDRRAAEWWLEQRRALGALEHASPDELVDEHRAHLHPLPRVVEALATHFVVGAPIRGAYLYRWDLDESSRPVEEEMIAGDHIPAVGARLIAHRRA